MVLTILKGVSMSEKDYYDKTVEHLKLLLKGNLYDSQGSEGSLKTRAGDEEVLMTANCQEWKLKKKTVVKDGGETKRKKVKKRELLDGDKVKKDKKAMGKKRTTKENINGSNELEDVNCAALQGR